MGPSQCPDDYTFGPIVQGCRDTFDFSLKFEKVFLAIIPACLFIDFSLARLAYLVRKPRIVRGLVFRIFKIASILVLAVLQVFLLPVLARGDHDPLYGLSIAACVVNFASALVMAVLSSVEHSKSPRPSAIISSYLLLSLLCDAIQIRTCWLMVNDQAQVIPFGVIAASVAVKALCLVLENWSKVRWLEMDANEHSPEEFGGMISLGVYSWLIPLLINGYAKVLSIDNLYPLEKDMTAERAQVWEPSNSQEKRTKVLALAWNLIWHLRVLFLLPVVPRLAQIAFYYSQPLFARLLLEHLERPHDPSMAVVGYGLVAAGTLIQIGTVLVMGAYGYFVVRFKCRLRSCLSTALYRKLCKTKPGKGTGDGAETVTLINTDVERVCDGLILIHELWAVPVEIAVGLWILHRELGSAFVVSIIAALMCSLASGWIARHARKHQHALMSAMQNRVTSTVSVIDHITSLHLTGIAGSVPGLVNSLRAVEIAASIRWNLFIVLTTLLGFVPLTITPVITLATTNSTLDVPTIFASLATMGILCYPLVLICRLLPLLQAAFTCLGRIRDNLEAEPRLDSRSIQEPSSSNVTISIEKGSFGWTDGNMVLTDIEATIPARQISMITGPVASGKSTLCKAILGEVPFSSGNVTLRTAYPGIGFCDQSPFLTNATIRNSIIGYARFDQKRFDEVVWATMLDEDIGLFPDSYSTMVGPGGSLLSGGQKQRLSFARALYLDSDILIVDDILNALDADTDAEVFSRVFGPKGIVRRRQVTALLCTNSPHHLRWADHIIALGAGGLVISDGPRLEDEKGSCPITKEEWSVAQDTLISKVQHAPPSSLPNEAEEAADGSRLLTNWKAYRFYARKTGLSPILLILLGGLLFSCFQNMATYWTTQWTRDLLKRPRSFCLGIFALFQTMMLVATLGEGLVAEMIVARRSGLEFHKSAMTALMAAPLSFFTSTEKGAIITLFSKDMRVINEEIPGSAARASHKGIQVVGMAIIFCLGSPYILIGYPVLFGVVFAIQRIFLRTCRQLNLLDLEFRGPLNTHFLDTINGMATMRAFGWVSDNVSHNNHLLNTSQRPAYLSGMLQQWLSLALKMVAACVAIAVIILSIQLSANAALTGASLATLSLFSLVLTGFVRSFTNLEVRMGSVNRLKMFSEDTPSQRRPTDFFPDKDWPRRGDVSLKHVSASYVGIGEETDTSPLPINDLSLAIRPGERVAICGRTGSGKSSVILLLLRLLDPIPSSSSRLSIDDIPLDRVDSDTLRRGIIAVPQDPVFLPAGSTMKSNLDPFNDATDQECIEALAAVHLSSLQAGIGELHQELGAESLSAGQQRLFALARAVLRCRIRNRNLLNQCLPVGGILLLDEVSFAADENTERIIQEIVKVEFKDYTIIMVSHQLRLVVGFFERVVVMEEGKVVEMGPPAELMNKQGGRFAQLWNTSERKGGNIGEGY